MPVKEEYHNVSVRLKDSDYQKLLFLHNKFSSMSYGKVTYADVLRIALTETFLRESNDPDNPVSNISKQDKQEDTKDSIVTVEEVEKAVKDNPVMLAKLAEIMSLSVPNSNTVETVEEAVTEETDASNDDTKEELTEEQEEELKQFEIKWRNSKNKKNKPYSEQYIQNQVNQKRKELAKTKYETQIEE
jgi:hypothetical protein